MKKINKTISRIITAITALAILLMCAPASAADCVISVDDTTVTEAGTVIAALRIENNPGMAVGKVTLSFDKTKLLPVSVSRDSGILQNSYSFFTNLDDENIDASELDSITITWVNMTNIQGDGMLATVEFTTVGDQTGDTDINVAINELANASQTDITANTKNGKVSFTGGGEEDPNGGIELGIANSTITKTDTKLEGSMKLSVYSPEAITAAFIFAVYDSSGILTAIKPKQDVALKSGINEVQLDEISSAVAPNTNYVVKVYMWNNMNGIVPLTDETITQQYS